MPLGSQLPQTGRGCKRPRIFADYTKKEQKDRMTTGQEDFFSNPLRIWDKSVLFDRLDVTSDWDNRYLTDWWAEEPEVAMEME
jgi:hypothetical protein